MGLSECTFRDIPKPRNAEVWRFVRGFVSSLICELQMNPAQRLRAPTQGVDARSHCVAQHVTTLLADFDRKPVHASECDAMDVGVHTTPKKFFDVQSLTLSLEDQFIKQVTSGPRAWPTPRQEDSYLTTLASNAARLSHMHNEAVTTTWYLRLTLPCMFVAKQRGDALRTSDCGVIMVPANIERTAEGSNIQ